MGQMDENYLIYKKLSEIYNLLEEIYPWASPYLIFNYNQLPERLFHYDLRHKASWKAGMVFLNNIDKFTIEKPKLMDPSLLSENFKFNFIIPNLNKLSKDDIKSFSPIQIVTWKGKTKRILDGMHRLYIAKELKEPIMCVEYKSHSYNNHPNNVKIKKIAKEIKNITG